MTNAKTTKKALFASVMSLLLCIAMLIGTTFAWFTDTASTDMNIIQAGKLDVTLLDANGDSLEGKTLNFKNTNGETITPLWEPGASFYTQKFQIKNNGNLHLEYTVELTGIDGNVELNKVMEWKLVSGNPTSWDEATESTLEMTGTLAPGASTDFVRLMGKMKESATNKYQGMSMNGVGITVHATQVEVEYDSFGNEYDKNASVVVTDAAELKAANIENATIILGESIALEGKLELAEGVTLDGAGKTLSVGTDSWTTDNNGKHLIQLSKGTTIKNIVLDSKSLACGVLAQYVTGVQMKNVTFINSKNAGLIINGSTVKASGLVAHGNVWGDINVDREGAMFTLTGHSSLAGGHDGQIWSEYSADCVTAEGYTYGSVEKDNKTYHYWNKTTE